MIILSVLFWSCVQISVLFLYLFALPLALFPKSGRTLIYFSVKWIVRIVFFLCFIRIKVMGKEKLPDLGRLIFIANHPGLIDPLYLVAYFPSRFRFVAEEKMFKIPLLGRVMKGLGCIASPSDPRDSFKLAQSVFSSLREGEPILIFPERPRKKEEIIAAFKPGAFIMAKSCEAAVVPIIIKGSEKVLPKGNLLVSPGEVKIYIDHPIFPRNVDDPIKTAGDLEKRFKEIL